MGGKPGIVNISQLMLMAQGIGYLRSYHRWVTAIHVSMRWAAQQVDVPFKKMFMGVYSASIAESGRDCCTDLSHIAYAGVSYQSGNGSCWLRSLCFLQHNRFMDSGVAHSKFVRDGA